MCGVPSTKTEEEVANLFSGAIKKGNRNGVFFIKNKTNNFTFNGHCTVTFEDPSSAKTAVQTFNGSTRFSQYNPLEVKMAMVKALWTEAEFEGTVKGQVRGGRGGCKFKGGRGRGMNRVQPY